METKVSAKTTDATLPKRNPKTGRFEKGTAKAKAPVTAKPAVTTAKKP